MCCTCLVVGGEFVEVAEHLRIVAVFVVLVARFDLFQALGNGVLHRFVRSLRHSWMTLDTPYIILSLCMGKRVYAHIGVRGTEKALR